MIHAGSSPDDVDSTPTGLESADTRSADRPSGERYDAFLSYSHADDGVAVAVERGLSRLMKRWHQRRALRVFLDRNILAANPDLWGRIADALDGSRYFILLASPHAAASPWVGLEVDHWLRTEPDRGRFLIVLAHGTIAWGEGDFDWDATDALPPGLRGWFTTEPKWVDLGWAHGEPRLSTRHSVFRRALAEVASPIHGVPVDDIEGEDVRQHRRITAVRRFAVAFLALSLVVVTGLLGYTAVLRGNAEDQRDAASSRDLASRSEAIGDNDPELARLLAVAAHGISPTGQARSAQLAATLRPGLAVLSPGGGAVGALAFSPDGGSLVVGTADKAMGVWDVATRRRVGEPVTGHEAAPTSIAFRPDGGLLATGDGADVRLWRLADRRPVEPERLALDPERTGLSTVDTAHRVAFSRDGRLLLSTAARGARIRMWDLVTRTATRPYVPSFGSVAAAFTADGGHLATLSGDNGHLNFLRTGDWAGNPVPAHESSPRSDTSPAVAISPDGRVLATVGSDTTLRFWDTTTRQPLGEPITGRVDADRAAKVPAIAFSPDGALFAAAGHGGTVWLWDTAGRRPVGEPLRGHTGTVTTAAFSPDGELLATGSSDGTVRLWRMSLHHAMAAPLAGHAGRVFAAAFSPDGRTLATGGDPRREASIPGRPYPCADGDWDMCFIGDQGTGSVSEGRTIRWTAGKERSWSAEGPAVHLWDLARREHVAALDAGTTAVRAVVFDADGANLFAGGLTTVEGTGGTSFLGAIYTWQVDTRQQRLHTLHSNQTIRSLVRHPDRHALTVASDLGGGIGTGGTVFEWKPETGTPSRTRLTDTTAYSATWSPDGRVVAAGLQDGRVKLWRDNAPKELERHGGPVGAVAVSPDATTLVTASDDGTVRLWNVADGTRIGEPLVGHVGPVYAAAFSPNGEILATGGGDHSVRLWHLPTRRQLAPPHLAHHGTVRSVAFSPDGRVLATGGDDGGVRLWDTGSTVDPQRSLCAATDRTLSAEEWDRYAPGLPHRTPCRG
ncbi:TIR domain-containing protein [Actinosynnema sp. CS-041913]|uniref:WD40 domain-containing protein n=1 Tax=Actinosynnema sp. CS-041913 TaxID=3239917 RepID=UPI003D91A393